MTSENMTYEMIHDWIEKWIFRYLDFLSMKHEPFYLPFIYEIKILWIKTIENQPLTFEACNVFSFYLYISFGSGDLWPLNLRVFEAFVCLKWIKTHIWDKYVYFSLNQATLNNLPLLLNQNTDICLIFFLFAHIQRKIRKRKQSAEAYWNFAHKSLLWARFRDFFMFIMGEVAWLALNKFCCYLDTQCLDLISIVNPFSGFINHPNRDIVWTKLV